MNIKKNLCDNTSVMRKRVAWCGVTLDPPAASSLEIPRHPGLSLIQWLGPKNYDFHSKELKCAMVE